MKKIDETLLEIGHYIYGSNRKVKMSEIITKFITSDEYPKLSENDVMLIELMLTEHNNSIVE